MKPRRTAKGPLRVVIEDYFDEVEVFGRKIYRHVKKLECGHIQRVRTDMYGGFHSYRRRCGECYRLIHLDDAGA